MLVTSCVLLVLKLAVTATVGPNRDFTKLSKTAGSAGGGGGGSVSNSRTQASNRQDSASPKHNSDLTIPHHGVQ